jgi:hypothetical protein
MAIETLHVDYFPLCSSTRTFIGVFVMICVIVSVLLFIANYFLNRGKPKTSKKSLLWLAGIAVFVLGVLSMAIYISLPPIMAALRGPDYFPADPCDPYSSSVYRPPEPPPFCGEYCHNQSVPKSSGNCTCLIY